MKKGLSILIALAMVVIMVPIAISADATTYSVSSESEFTTAASSVQEGDKIQLVADVHLNDGKMITISGKNNITIDTNGYQWTAGGINASDGKPKEDCILVTNSTVTITNSKRTGQVTADTPFDIISANSQTYGGAIRVDSGGHVTLRNIAIASANVYTQNVPTAVRIHDANSSLTIDNCYLTNTRCNTGVAMVVSSGVAANNVNISNTIFGGQGASFAFLDTASTSESHLSFTNCTFLNQIAVSKAVNTSSFPYGSSSVASVNLAFNGCTGTTIYGDYNAEFTGTNAFTDVRAGVVVSAGEGTALYSDSTYATPLTAGALEADTPVYSTGGSVSPTNPTEPVDNLAVDVEMVSGASIRLNNVTGIRFYTSIDTNKIAALVASGATVEMGTLIAPLDLIGANELDFDLNPDYYLDIPYTYESYYQEGSFEGIVGSIVNIKETTVANPTSGNITRDFVGRGYVKVTYNDETVISYADYASGNIDNNTRSLAQVSYALQNDANQTALYNTYKDTVDRWASFYQA